VHRACGSQRPLPPVQRRAAAFPLPVRDLRELI
jgi:hypothetical protein